MRVGVIHNLQEGGARRRLSEQMTRVGAETVEVCLSTATPIREDAHVIPFSPAAPHVARPLRVPLRYADLLGLLRGWRRVASCLNELDVDVVYANPCRFVQAPAALLGELPPTLYFCDEPRRVDFEPAASARRNPLTRPVYAPMYAAERRVDRRAVGRAARVVTNSSFSAGQIQRAYGRRAEAVPMGVAEPFLSTEPRAPAHLLSVGTLIPSKGHDIAIVAAGRAKRRWPVVVVAPGPDPEESARLHAIAREADVQLNVRVGISDGELAEAYAAAQATLYMAELEPFGLASIEAQATGSPTIVAAEGGLPETIVAERTGWAVTRTPESVAARLDSLDEPGIRARMSAAAREHVAPCTWERSAQAVESILAELAR